jgi:hypothetical protein
MARRVTEPTKWRKIRAGAEVELKGQLWHVETIDVGKKKVAVTLSRVGKPSIKYSGKVDPEAKVPAMQWVKSKPGESVFDTFARDQAKKQKKRAADPEPLIGPAGKEWLTPQGPAEVAIVGKLDGKLVGVQPGKGEWYICPPVDVSTIAGHLYLFHGVGPVDVRRVGGYDEAVVTHDVEHARKPTLGPLKVPHTHDPKRPAIAIGPIPR